MSAVYAEGLREDSEPIVPATSVQSFEHSLFSPAEAAAFRRTTVRYSIVPEITSAVNRDAIDSIHTSGDLCHHTQKGSLENRFHLPKAFR